MTESAPTADTVAAGAGEETDGSSFVLCAVPLSSSCSEVAGRLADGMQIHRSWVGTVGSASARYNGTLLQAIMGCDGQCVDRMGRITATLVDGTRSVSAVSPVIFVAVSTSDLCTQNALCA